MKYLNALNKITGVGAKKMQMLLNFFENSENIWQSDLNSLKNSGVGEKLAEKIFLEKASINPDFEWERMQEENIQMLTFSDYAYPTLLKEIPNPPFILYKKGALDLNYSPMISIVGSRKYSSYGSQIAQSLARDLSNAGVIIVSGMALGIDTFAHQGALENHGKTIAVLGNSLDDKNIYPVNNFNLSREIMIDGALISEYPIEMKAGKLTFPARNRIVAGLTLGTIVIEAGEKSGSLITANMALEYNREVFSVPGSIFSPLSYGTNNLIKSGARVVTGIKDILEELDLSKENLSKELLPKNPTTDEEKILLKILSSDPLHIDNIAKLAKLQTAMCSGTLSMMEIKGWVKNIGGQNYIII
ncbi:MAG: DNA-processing protein DprA [Candidatus Moraniibacteriota bacterium]